MDVFKKNSNPNTSEDGAPIRSFIGPESGPGARGAEAGRAPPVIDMRSFLDDPHGAFAALRETHPVVQVGVMQYFVLRAREVLDLFTDGRTRQITGGDYIRFNAIPEGFTAQFIEDVMLFNEGEEHRAKRGLFARTFTYALMRSKRPDVAVVADRIVAALPRGETFDFVDRMAARVPAEMIATILGLPVQDAQYFAPRVYALSKALTPIYPHACHNEIEAATAELYAYVAGQLRSRQRVARSDVLTSLVAAWSADPVIGFSSLVNQVIGVILAGSDTTRAAFAMLVALLLEHPEQWDAVKRDPDLIPGAIAEGMRFEPSVGSISRTAVVPMEIAGMTVPAGAMLRLSTMSAMRDPGLYSEPDRFDIRRDDHPRLHAVFGMGPHRCLGEMLARIEMEESLAALIRGAPDLAMEARPQMTGLGGIRQITPMPVRIH
ncbi:cytochrome P450 [Acuticoccus sediminis]|uniref:cytochrome P450 n=1 Tax=Acuticoccus sediminis TaxID=2184697 RepID=UPI001CFCED3E|nr:cytochrome P450 [Acuticoccus sediminis]